LQLFVLFLLTTVFVSIAIVKAVFTP